MTAFEGEGGAGRGTDCVQQSAASWDGLVIMHQAKRETFDLESSLTCTCLAAHNPVRLQHTQKVALGVQRLWHLHAAPAHQACCGSLAPHAW